MFTHLQDLSIHLNSFIIFAVLIISSLQKENKRYESKYFLEIAKYI